MHVIGNFQMSGNARLSADGAALADSRAARDTHARRNGGDITLADLPINPNDTTSGTSGLRATLSLPLAAS